MKYLLFNFAKPVVLPSKLMSAYFCFFLFMAFSMVANAQDTLIQRGHIWRFLDTGDNPGIGWTEQHYPDKNWSRGPSPLGYDTRKEFDISTNIDFGGDLKNKPPVSFFKTNFLLEKANQYIAYQLNYMRDDGILIYINNREVVRSNIPDDATDISTFAKDKIVGVQESEVLTIYLEPFHIREGINTIAASVHQSTPISSDIFFDLEIIGIQDIGILHKFIEKQDQSLLLENDKISLLNKTYELNEEKIRGELQSKLITTQWVVLLGMIFFIGILVFIFYRYYLYRLEESKKHEKEKEKLEKKVQHQENEIISHSISNIRNKSFLKELKTDLMKVSASEEKAQNQLTKLINRIKMQSDIEDEWEKLKLHFDSAYSGFFERLSQRCPELSQQELKHCGLMKVQLDTKEISQIIRVAPKSVQAARYRIKKKLHLPEKEDLREFIIKF